MERNPKESKTKHQSRPIIIIELMTNGDTNQRRWQVIIGTFCMDIRDVENNSAGSKSDLKCDVM